MDWKDAHLDGQRRNTSFICNVNCLNFYPFKNQVIIEFWEFFVHLKHVSFVKLSDLQMFFPRILSFHFQCFRRVEAFHLGETQFFGFDRELSFKPNLLFSSRSFSLGYILAYPLNSFLYVAPKYSLAFGVGFWLSTQLFQCHLWKSTDLPLICLFFFTIVKQLTIFLSLF